MAVFRFSRGAEADLLGIGDYTLRAWGQDQTGCYLGELEACCQRLAGNPTLGRACDEVRPWLLRAEQGRHTVFYRKAVGGTVVVRILHQACFPRNTWPAKTRILWNSIEG